MMSLPEGADQSQRMRGGITYDTGFFDAGTSTHEPFDSEVVRSEMRVIRDELHCNAVRVTGGDQGRLETAAMLRTLASRSGCALSPATSPLASCSPFWLIALNALSECAKRAPRSSSWSGLN
jgi:hypothetical protein